MSNYLAIDIGAGTMDVLCYVPGEKMHYKAVVQSPVRTLARRIEAVQGNLVVTGLEMGGGPVTAALQARARSHRVVISRTASATLHHDIARVIAMGIEVVGDDEADQLARESSTETIRLGDLEPNRIRSIVESFGLPFEFEAVAVCAQDHGVAPPGVSHLDFRHQLFKARLDKTPFPHTLLFPQQDLPPEFNRLASIASAAAQLPTKSVYVMDSGMAAMVGASLDPMARGKDPIMVLDIATSHTVGAVLENGELSGSFEYHTHDITLDRLERLLVDLPDGRLEHDRILEEGGHGAYLRNAPGYQRIGAIIATGPKRRLLNTSTLPVLWGAPWGDNMMTGCAGLLESLNRRLEQSFLEFDWK
jgi:uncharacterized protein (DUF1786 family)